MVRGQSYLRETAWRRRQRSPDPQLVSTVKSQTLNTADVSAKSATPGDVKPEGFNLCPLNNALSMSLSNDDPLQKREDFATELRKEEKAGKPQDAQPSAPRFNFNQDGGVEQQMDN